MSWMSPTVRAVGGVQLHAMIFKLGWKDDMRVIEPERSENLVVQVVLVVAAIDPAKKLGDHPGLRLEVIRADAARQIRRTQALQLAVDPFSSAPGFAGKRFRRRRKTASMAKHVADKHRVLAVLREGRPDVADPVIQRQAAAFDELPKRHRAEGFRA